jgi:hypothetical protein
MNWRTPSGKNVGTSDVITAFNNLDVTRPSDADQLFADYGIGNHTLGIVGQYECLYVYEHMLKTMLQADENKYTFMHKGTPYYFMSWAAFAIEDYEKAVFYLDAAVSEDIKLGGGNPTNTSWHGTPAGSFLLLNGSLAGPSARHLTQKVEHKVANYLTKFSSVSGENLDKQTFIDQFVITSISDSGFRSIISGLYVFLLEHSTRRKQLELRSSEKGSIQPFLTHLFKGALVFESLLKRNYASSIGRSNPTLGAYLRLPATRSDLEINSSVPLYNSPTKPKTFPRLITSYSSWSGEPFQEKSIATAYAIRNTTGHDLSWPDHFTLQVYDDLVEALLNAIFWIVLKIEI